MSVYWNEKTRRLEPYIPGEQPKEKPIIKLNTNENPYPPCPLVIETIRKAADGNLRLYPDPASERLREAAAERWGVDPALVFPGNGSDEVLAFAFAAFFEAQHHGGSPILFQDITYSFYPVYANLWDIDYELVPLQSDFTVNTAAMCAPSGGIVLANPNAPTGIALTREEIRRIAAAAERDKKVVIIDEAYIAFADENCSSLPLLDDFPNLLVIRTLSKEASLAGLRAGFAFGSKELVEGLWRVRDSFNSYTIGRLVSAGAAAALANPAYYDEVNRRIVATRERLAARLVGLGFTVLPSSANFVFISPPAASGLSGAEFTLALRKRSILVRHFDRPRIADFIRVSIGTDDEMDVFLAACEKILRS